MVVHTVAQRLVDRWAIIDTAFLNKKINKSDLIDILVRINKFKEVIYCEDVREFVIKNLSGSR